MATRLLDTGQRVEIPADEVAEIEREAAEYEVWLAANRYKFRRQAEYPPLVDQIEAIMKGGADLDAMRATLAAIRERHPKP
jgi:hypothetical protein